jgi:hypothetical protein
LSQIIDSADIGRLRLSSSHLPNERRGPHRYAIPYCEHIVGGGKVGSGLASLKIVITVFKPKDLDWLGEL